MLPELVDDNQINGVEVWYGATPEAVKTPLFILVEVIIDATQQRKTNSPGKGE